MFNFIERLLFRQHVHQVKISFFRLDPETQQLAIYNNLTKKIRGFDLYISNNVDEEFKVHIKSLDAQDGIVLPLTDVKSPQGIPFTGDVLKVRAHTSSGIEKFVRRGNCFKRVIKSKRRQG